ncbi:lasso peptide biosynthesis protein [Jidongwangia harbinensis]|uniref:lasso peptide biosynthesis protein n=1 Tax=Jidongwangia harbinensis TaxID=2878561 RepID=UPI001CD98C61|nr:lasso peptide biosynthesis protein [Jidongwangia harbinensis]MCA2211685.1 lasso peptide biosynthesis protein [Jidongwangia harbinensis]
MPLTPGAWVRTAELGAALVAAVRIGRVFAASGLAAALAEMPPVSSRKPARRDTGRAAIFCARSAGWRLQGLLRTVTGWHRCLHESLALVAGLRTLGFPVEVVIGYPVIERPDNRDELHAWPALGGTPLVGRPDSSRTNYLELARYPGPGTTAVRP